MSVNVSDLYQEISRLRAAIAAQTEADGIVIDRLTRDLDTSRANEGVAKIALQAATTKADDYRRQFHHERSTRAAEDAESARVVVVYRRERDEARAERDQAAANLSAYRNEFRAERDLARLERAEAVEDRDKARLRLRDLGLLLAVRAAARTVNGRRFRDRRDMGYEDHTALYQLNQALLAAGSIPDSEQVGEARRKFQAAESEPGPLAGQDPVPDDRWGTHARYWIGLVRYPSVLVCTDPDPGRAPDSDDGWRPGDLTPSWVSRCQARKETR